MKDSPVIVDVRAIDVGYFSTKFSLGRKAHALNALSTSLFPSIAPRVRSEISPSATGQGDRDVTIISINGCHYCVGRDASLSAAGVEPREILGDYCLSEKYLALSRGAMHYMAQDVLTSSELLIRNLVVGLPLNNYVKHKDFLTSRLTGEHLLAPDASKPWEGNRRVVVENVYVTVQPQGAVSHYTATHGISLGDHSILVIDPGGGTLDWYVVKGGRSNWERSGAHPKSMLACAYAVADAIDPTWRDNIEVVNRIDKALREKASFFRAGGKEHRLANFKNEVDAVLLESTEKMLASVGSLSDLDLILFSGGGAGVYFDFFLRKHPEFASTMKMGEEPVYSNVKGFHVLGEFIASRNAARKMAST